MQIVVDPAHRADETVSPDLLARAVQVVDAAGGGRIDWWVFDARPAVAAAAVAAGFTGDRDLLQMRRPLPADRPSSVATRSFVVGHDEQRWLEVNNRAFAGHPEQGDWDLATLRRRMAEPWFDAGGFRLHEIDGRLAAFCWTKIHDVPDGSQVGEIYVIGVDPDFQGMGLGRELTLAGLDSIVAHGVGSGMLYVDGANAPAIGLYRALGFTVARTDRAYVRPAS
jgi:mycothiol synthase